jgi:peptidoglycan/LPS O-acetylase OafA/YrhL
VKALDGVFAPERDGEIVDDRAHLPALDGLRGLAILLVVMLHLTLQIHDPSGMGARILKRVFFFGWSGVDLFFVLSGFLITGILDDAKGTSNYFRVFYARRMLRILPLYYGALLILFVLPHLVTAAGAHRFIVPLKDQLWYWFYLQNFHPLPNLSIGLAGHFWTLAIEEQFYLVWPVVILACSRKNALRICGGLFLLSVVFRLFTANFNPWLGAYTNTLGHLDGLAVGSALALLYRSPGGVQWVKRRMAIVAVSSGAASVALYLIPFSRVRHVTQGAFLALLFGCLLVHAAATGTRPLQRFFRSGVMRFFGRYSYGMYVIHVPLISITMNLTGIGPSRLAFFGSELTGVLLFIIVMLGMVTAAAWVSYNFYEKRFLRLKRRFVYRRPLASVPRAEGKPALGLSV